MKTGEAVQQGTEREAGCAKAPVCRSRSLLPRDNSV